MHKAFAQPTAVQSEPHQAAQQLLQYLYKHLGTQKKKKSESTAAFR